MVIRAVETLLLITKKSLADATRENPVLRVTSR